MKAVTTPVITIGKPLRVVVPRAMTAAMWRQTVPTMAVAGLARRKSARQAILEHQERNPRIRLLNGSATGSLTPGGDYDIGGNGFGPAEGRAFVRYAGRLIPMSVVYWNERSVGVKVPGDLSRLADGAAELAVVPVGKAPMTTRAFGFTAAREDVPIRVSDEMFAHLGAGTIRLPGTTRDLAISSPPHGRGFDDGWNKVWRRVDDAGGNKRCINPGSDKMFLRGLRNGYQLTAWWFARDTDFANANKTALDSSTQARGAWAFKWEPDGLHIDFGVTRTWHHGVGVYGGRGYCHSNYQVKLVATGPRGLAAQ